MKITIKLVSVILLAIVAAFGVSAVEITDFSQLKDFMFRISTVRKALPLIVCRIFKKHLTKVKNTYIIEK